MKINYNQFLAVAYADVFDWPLEEAEMKIQEIQESGYKIQGGKKEIRTKNGYYFLPGREKLVKQRLVKEKMSVKKKIIAKVVTSFLSKIPTVEAIFLTGSVAVGSAKKGSDIDLMIITSANTLWLTRLVLVVLLKGLQNYGNGRDRICPNIFLDANHLEIREKNLYTAHEVLQARCLFDRGGVEKKWLVKNKWARKFLPNAYNLKIKNCKIVSLLEIKNWKLEILGLLEPLVFVCEYLYQLPKQTKEKVGWGVAFFHPKNLSEKVVREFGRRIN